MRRMRQQILRTSVVGLAAVLMAACSSFTIESKKIDYKSAGKLPPLEIPPDLTTPARDDRYAVPDLNPKGSATYSVYNSERADPTRTSTAPEVLPQVDRIRVERSGTQRWLVVALPPDKLWQTVKDFWQENGFIINHEVPEAGIMETDWAENRAKVPQDLIRNVLGKFIDQIYSTAERDKFRTRLEIGTKPGQTEIYISHRGLSEVYATEGRDRTVWQPRPADPELEAEMLRRLMVRLGTEEDRAKQLVAQEAREERARIARGADGVATLQMQEAFDRAWRRVGLALDRVGFTVEDRDRSQGIYFVRYVDPEEDAKTRNKDSGFLSKLMFWRGSKTDPASQAQYRIHVKGGQDQSTVEILTREGGLDRSETAKKILGLLFEQLK